MFHYDSYEEIHLKDEGKRCIHQNSTSNEYPHVFVEE